MQVPVTDTIFRCSAGQFHGSDLRSIANVLQEIKILAPVVQKGPQGSERLIYKVLRIDMKSRVDLAQPIRTIVNFRGKRSICEALTLAWIKALYTGSSGKQHGKAPAFRRREFLNIRPVEASYWLRYRQAAAASALSRSTSAFTSSLVRHP